MMESILEKVFLSFIVAVFIGAMVYFVYDIMRYPAPSKQQVFDPGDPLCRSYELRGLGGLASETAYICYVPDVGWLLSSSFNRLLDEDWHNITGPMFRSVRYSARSMGVYNEDHNVWIYQRKLRNRPDRYSDRG